MKPVANTNIIATPENSSLEISFAISGQNGRYRLKLASNKKYSLEITHLGFAKIVDSVHTELNGKRDFILKPSTESLDEVVIESEMAILVKGDTTTYKTDYFKTGDERKLRDILKKLPGVNVENGNVTINGKKVSNLMVDGKDFFGGSTKLGVQNIPAGVVDEIQALDHYNEVGFMKGLNDSDRMALNIKLKKDKKEFIFGESEAGGGIKERYTLKPTLFYYSPKTMINLIGSFNNTGEAALSFSELYRFSGSGSGIDNPVKSGSPGLYKFQGGADVQFQKTQFGATNLIQQINPDLSLETYSLVGNQKTRDRTTQEIEYLTQDNFIENRETNSRNSNFSHFSKIKLRYRPSIKTDMAYHIKVNNSNSFQKRGIQSVFKDSTNSIQRTTNPSDVNFSQYFRLNRQASFSHTSVLKAKYVYREKNAQTNWIFDRPVFQDLIPIEKSGMKTDLLHNYSSTSHQATVDFKHFWILNNFNHIYPKIGLSFSQQDYSSKDFQKLKNGEINDFKSAGFNNDIDYTLFDPYIGFQYKIKLDKLILKPGVIYHHYFWDVKQFGQEITNKNKGAILPEFLGRYEFSSVEELKFNYSFKSSFTGARNFANRFRLNGFNRIYRGNKDLENALYHRFSLSYRKSNLFKKLTYNFRLGFSSRVKSIRNATQLQGIDQISTTFYTGLPENKWNFSGEIEKELGDYELGLETGTRFSNYSRLINGERIDYKNYSLKYSLSAGTNFQHWPNFSVGFNQRFSETSAENFLGSFSSLHPFGAFRYAFWKGFIARMDYSFTRYNNLETGQVNNFQKANASLYYRKKNSPWGFLIETKNLFDLRFKNSNSYNQYLVYDRQNYIQPRTLLLKISYQL